MVRGGGKGRAGDEDGRLFCVPPRIALLFTATRFLVVGSFVLLLRFAIAQMFLAGIITRIANGTNGGQKLGIEAHKSYPLVHNTIRLNFFCPKIDDDP